MDWLPTSIPGNAKTHAGARTSPAPLGADKPSGHGLVHSRNLRGRWKDREAKRRKTFLMKRANNLFPKLVSEENLRLAIFAVNVTHRFRPHHRPNRTVARVEADVDRYVKELREIITGGYEANEPRLARRWDKSAGKWRDISEPRLWPDQYVHHAVIQVLEPMLERIETNSQFAQFVTPNEMTSIVTMSIKIGEVEGLMNVCIPYAVLEPVIDKVNTKYWYSTSVATGDGTYRDYLEESLQRAQIPVRAIMGRSAISVNDFIHLQPGDIIKVNTRLEDELDVYVGNIKKFSAIPGAYEDSYAVKIKSIYREE